MRLRMRILGVLASCSVHRVHSFLVTKIDHQGLCGIVVGHFLQTHTADATHRRRSSAQLSSMTQKHLGSQIALIWSGLQHVVVVVAVAALIAAKRSNNSMSKCQSKPFDIFITHSTGWPNRPHANWPWHAEDIFECVRCAAWCITHTLTHSHTLEKDSGNELEEKATRAVCVAGCDTTRHEVIARSSSVNCNSIQCDQLAQSQQGNKVRCPYASI